MGSNLFQSPTWALVTGSSSGIGLAIAQKLATEGCGIVLHGIENQTRMNEISTEFKKQFQAPTFAVSADLSDPQAIQNMLSQISDQKINLDILINNAGFQHVAPIETFPLNLWQKMLDVHLTAPMILVQKLIPHMRAQKFGRIINMASVHGQVASVNKSAYVAAKHGLIGFTKAMALETAGQGITCNAICPGWVQTPLVENQINDRAKNENITFDQARENLLGEKQPSKQFVSTDELASLVIHLCSRNSQAMTGAVLTVDGGWTSQ
jgi:3-hydroxybutyrate dehydrogenase